MEQGDAVDHIYIVCHGVLVCLCLLQILISIPFFIILKLTLSEISYWCMVFCILIDYNRFLRILLPSSI